MASDVRNLKNIIARTLWQKPSSFDELLKRDCLANKAPLALDLVISHMLRDNEIYKRNNKFYCYKETALSLLE
jgi:hypothetical protein